MNAIAEISIPSDLPELADAMTAADMWAHCVAIAKAIGRSGASASVMVSHDDSASVMVRESTNYRDDAKFFHAATWPAAFQEAHAWAATRKAVSLDTFIRRMALAIIDLTDQHGECTERLLRGQDFSRDEILAHHEAACVRAGEMATGTPFRVVLSGVVA